MDNDDPTYAPSELPNQLMASLSCFQELGLRENHSHRVNGFLAGV